MLIITSHMALSMQEWPSVCEIDPKSWRVKVIINIMFVVNVMHYLFLLIIILIFCTSKLHPFQLGVDVASLFNVALLNNRPTS